MINRKNFWIVWSRSPSYSVGRWEWVHLFPQNLWKESRKNPQDQFPFFPNFWWGCCVIVRENQQRTGSGNKKEKSDGRFYSEKNWILKAEIKIDILRNGRKNPHQYHIIGDWKEGNSFIWVHCLWGVFLFLNISVLLRIGDGVVVSVSVPYSVLLCAIVRLFYLTLLCLSTFETRVSTSLNVIALLVTFQRCDSTACGYSSAVDTTRR